MSRFVRGKMFFGNIISDYGIEHNRVDYGTLAKAFDTVYNGEIIEKTQAMDYYWECVNGSEEYYEDLNGTRYTYDEITERMEELAENIDDIESNSELDIEMQKELEKYQHEMEDLSYAANNPCYEEIYQYYIISDEGAKILSEWTDEIVLYNSDLDMYVWCITHYGTSWDYVLTDIKCNVGNDYEG